MRLRRLFVNFALTSLIGMHDFFMLVFFGGYFLECSEITHYLVNTKFLVHPECLMQYPICSGRLIFSEVGFKMQGRPILELPCVRYLWTFTSSIILTILQII